MSAIKTGRERAAVIADARQRLDELEAVRDLLLPDRDDPLVLSELCSIDGQIRAAQKALAEREEMVRLSKAAYASVGALEGNVT